MTNEEIKKLNKAKPGESVEIDGVKIKCVSDENVTDVCLSCRFADNIICGKIKCKNKYFI